MFMKILNYIMFNIYTLNLNKILNIYSTIFIIILDEKKYEYYVRVKNAYPTKAK